MADVKTAAGTAATMLSASGSWLDVAEPIVTMIVTLAVGGATLWYTIERSLKLRKERKQEKE